MRLTQAIGDGLLAGTVGTAAMTLSSTIEMKLRRRGPSTVPARAAARVLGVEPTSARERERFNTVAHWAYGIGWGAARGVIGVLGFRGVPAAALFLSLVWTTELVTLPALDIGVPPVTRWGAEEVAVDALHHLVYAGVTSAAYEVLERCG
jgi:hypothetical protein